MLRSMQSRRCVSAFFLLLLSLPSVAPTHTWDASIQDAAKAAAENENKLALNFETNGTLTLIHWSSTSRAALSIHEFNITSGSQCHMQCSKEEEHAAFIATPDGTPGTWTVLFFFVCLLFGVFMRQILAKVQDKTGLRIPSTVGLLILGMIIGAIIWPESHGDFGVPNEMFSVSTMVWEQMEPKLILFMFLPCLIFEGSMSTDYFIFSKQFAGGMALAFPGMVLQILMVAGFAMYGFPYGWGFGESMLFGSILSATDPVAVIALMKELALLGDLRVLIEAESLLNDGSAIVAYELCYIVLVHPGSIGEYISLAITLTICAPLIGTACFLAMRLWSNKTMDPIQETILTVAAAYLCYYLCESGLHISGVLAVLTLGLLYNGYGSSALSSEEAQHMCHNFWEIFVWVADTIIFVLAGILIIQEGFLSNSFTWVGSDWGYLMALYLALFAFRIAMVIVCAPVLRYTCFGMQQRVCSRERFFKYMFILSWGGLRGIVGLVLAMVVSIDHHLGDAVSDKHFGVRVLIHVGGIVVLTTLLNAATLELLIEKLGLKSLSSIETQLVQGSVSALSRRNKVFIREVQNPHDRPELSRVDWESVQEIVGFEDNLLQGKNIEKQKQRRQGALTVSLGRHLSTEQTLSSNQTSKEDDKISMMDQYFHSSLLLALRCSFDSQYKDGLLSGAAFRQLSWGINTALDHCYNRATWSGEKETSFGDRFEWGWLISEGFLDPPKWLSYCKILGSSFANHFTRGDDARRLELFLAISRAHEEVCKSESVLDPAFAAHLIQESQQIKVQADKQFAALALLSPDIASAVVTRQTCQLVLKDFLHEVENLYENAQLKATDFASMKEDILAKRRELLSYLPEADEKHVSNLRQENLRRYLPLDGHLIKNMTKKSFKAGEMILKGNLRADAIYFVEKGTVQLKLGEDEGDIAMFGDGCCINDTQVLLDDAGFDSQNVSDVIAVTEVSMHCLTFRSLSDMSGHKLGKHEQDFFILRMWQYAGCLLSLRNPELFNFVMPPAGFQWASATMAIKEKGARLILSGRCLLVQGILEKRLGSLPPQNKLKRVNDKLEASPKRGGGGFHAIEAFAYLSPTECDACVFIVKTDKCKLLLSPDAMCMDADESNVELSNRMKQASLPEDDDSTWNHHPLKDQPIWSCDYGCQFVGTAAAVRKHEQTCDLKGREQARSAQDLTIPRTESGPGSAGSSFITRFPSIMARRSSLITDSKSFISRTESEENKQRVVQRRSSIIVDPGSKQNALAKSRTPALQANGHTEDIEIELKPPVGGLRSANTATVVSAELELLRTRVQEERQEDRGERQDDNSADATVAKIAELHLLLATLEERGRHEVEPSTEMAELADLTASAIGESELLRTRVKQ